MTKDNRRLFVGAELTQPLLGLLLERAKATGASKASIIKTALFQYFQREKL